MTTKNYENMSVGLHNCSLTELIGLYRICDVDSEKLIEIEISKRTGLGFSNNDHDSLKEIEDWINETPPRNTDQKIELIVQKIGAILIISSMIKYLLF